MTFIAIALNGKPCQIIWFLSCLAAISRGDKLIWKFRHFRWQVVLTVEMRARQHLFQSNVYSKLMSYVMNIQSDHTVVHTESCFASAKSGSEVCNVKVLSGWPPCYLCWGDSSVHTLLSGCFTITTLSAELLRLERVFGQISQAENVCKKAFSAYNTLSCSFLLHIF